MGQWENAYKAAEAVLTEKNTLEDFNDEAFILPNNYQSVENITALERGMSSNYTQAAVLSEALASSYGEGDLRLDAYFKPADKNGYRFKPEEWKRCFR